MELEKTPKSIASSFKATANKIGAEAWIHNNGKNGDLGVNYKIS